VFVSVVGRVSKNSWACTFIIEECGFFFTVLFLCICLEEEREEEEGEKKALFCFVIKAI
jgi:hypothetical protein